MAGLLDILDSDEGRFGMGLLAAGGPSMTPMSFGQRLAGAMQGIQADKAAREDRAMKQKLIDAQIGNYASESEARKVEAMQKIAAIRQAEAQRAAMAGSFVQPQQAALNQGAAQGSIGPTLHNGVRMDAMDGRPQFQPNIQALVASGMKPEDVAKFLELKNAGRDKIEKWIDTTGGPTGVTQQGMTAYGDRVGGAVPKPVEMKLEAGQAYNPFQLSAGQTFADPNKPFSLGPGGSLVPNTPFQQYETSKARAGATNVNVSTEKAFGTTMAEGLAKDLTAQKAAADSAASSIGAINRIRGALDSGKIVSGPLSTPEMALRQIGELSGFGGKSNTETLTNTRTAIQGFAQLSLNSAKAMQGQGQITENERKLLERAASGDISSMTPAEIRTVVDTHDRIARMQISNYQKQVEKLKTTPGMDHLVPFLSVNEPEGYKPRVPRYNPATGKIE